MMGDFSEGGQNWWTANFQKVVGSVVVLFDTLSPAVLGVSPLPREFRIPIRGRGNLKPLYALFDVPLLFKHARITAIRFIPAI
jgi:hypothetical protein